MRSVDVTVHDDPPPEWHDSTVENDLGYAAAAGGLTDIDEVDADDGDQLRVHTDADVRARTRAWLDENPEAVGR